MIDINLVRVLQGVADFLRDYGMPDTADACVQAADKIERLRAIIDKSPKCWRLNEHGELVQDVPITPGMVVWFCLCFSPGVGGGYEIISDKVFSTEHCENDFIRVNLLTHDNYIRPEELYLTREAAEAAKEKTQ